MQYAHDQFINSHEEIDFYASISNSVNHTGHASNINERCSLSAQFHFLTVGFHLKFCPKHEYLREHKDLRKIQSVLFIHVMIQSTKDQRTY